MNLTVKQFKAIYYTFMILPVFISVVLSFLDIGKSFRNLYPAFMLIPLFLIIIRRNTHPSEFPKMKWTSSMIVAAGILIFFFGLKIANSY